MAKEEKALAPEELSRARAALAAAQGKRRLDLVLEARDPQALVRALPADELYFTIRDIGLGDAALLVQLASPEQFKTFLDLDAWRGGAFEPRRALPWLRVARAGAHLDPKAAARWTRKLDALDREVLYLVLRDALHLHDLEEDPDPELVSDRFMRTPEGRFVVEFQVEGTEYLAVRGLLDDFYARDAFQATRLLSALRGELPSELEETALRWRTGRLADLGFPSLEEALSWFARPPRAPARPAGPPPARPPGFLLATLGGGSAMDRAAAALPAGEREVLEREIVAAANAVLVADQVDPSDLQAVRGAFAAARAMLELGLARLAGADPDRAAQVLAETPVKRLFQEGFGRVLELKWRAERLLAGGGAGSRAAPLLDAPLGEAVASLAAKRPRYFPGLEAPRDEWGTMSAAAHEPRRFLAAAELDRTAAALDLAEGLAGLAQALGLAGGRAEGPLAPRLSTLYLTALANERLGRAFRPDPVARAELPGAARALAAIEDPRLASAGQAGALLLELARARAAELAPIAEGGTARPEHLSALLVLDPD
ncbi:conserved hypothetical protein [Anaeromyxobacter dehalogenans 2CP-1]|uniref:Uncharacterized protein n=1 Tax=Anaeromyxobacter dehalogenans (strain ATCC BAA-258 / DSM 21875 / 2CP-1) TaxID=455488 RepID=B8JDJ5_ANAD2|nr:DUF6178 family protein [Anaeromyxobacter dehalogenans]ACL66044.1 conserved hypothetical protein [Anaeromyxobacter dehalogenans 2CP-1]